MRPFALLLLATSLLFGDSFRLFLKSGEYQRVTEYKVEGDRVRYYSSERGAWEEIPLELCDLRKTESERQQHLQDVQRQARLADDEEKLERAERREVERIPMNPGAYFVQKNQVRTLEYAESDLVKSKKRQLLQKITPIPIVAGKATLQLKGEHATFSVQDNLPEFYVRLENEDRFSILQLTPAKGVRIVEDVSIVPVSNQNIENPKQIPTFQKELASGLYRVWPEKPLEPGEYAVIEYAGTNQDSIDMRIWDFAYSPTPQ